MMGMIFYDDNEEFPIHRLLWCSCVDFNVNGGVEIPTESTDLGLPISLVAKQRPTEISVTVRIHEATTDDVNTTLIYLGTDYDTVATSENMGKFGTGASLFFMEELEKRQGKLLDIQFSPSYFFKRYVLASWSVPLKMDRSVNEFTLSFIRKLDVEVSETELVIKHKASNSSTILNTSDAKDNVEKQQESEDETLAYQLWKQNRERVAEAYKKDKAPFRQSIGSAL